jgi:hypothetical protein
MQNKANYDFFLSVSRILGTEEYFVEYVKYKTKNSNPKVHFKPTPASIMTPAVTKEHFKRDNNILPNTQNVGRNNSKSF